VASQEVGGRAHGAQRLGLGLAALGRPAYITTGREGALGSERTVEAMRARAEEVLDAALDLGVRYLDAARSYGRAEEFLAGWLRRRREAGTLPDDVRVGSKWGYTYVGDWRLDADVHEVKDHSLETFRRQRAETLELLPAGDLLAVYHVHSVVPGSPALTDPALHAALAELREGGVAVGVSTSGPRQADAVRAALAVRVGGEPLYTSMQATWNLLEPSAEGALSEAHAAGAAVVVKEAVANGRLTGADPALPPAVRAAAERLGVGPDAVATAAALAQPWATTVLSGAVSVEQLASNADALALSRSDLDLEALAALAEPAEEYWAARSRRPWA
jgi:aryl-alcohol dehydrogenase-like predicted oxidoreductase